MNVTSATDTASTRSSATGLTQSASNNVVDQNTFLQLLIAQMRNQDPTNPMDSSQMMGQFAQMSQVEQAVQTNSKLDALLSSQALSQADSLIGRTVKFTSDDGTTVSGKIKSVSINKDGAVANLEDGTSVFVGPGLTLS
jgi:flagellar basal-body rod modification protein FlgD